MNWYRGKRPEESGWYLCITDKYRTMSILHYSKKHDGFNCFDSLEDKKGEMKVKYWMELPKPPEGVRS